MKGHTENTIAILVDYETVFDLTNDIEKWPELFTEYEKAEVLKQEGNVIEFRLTMFPEEGKPAKSWVSRRILNKSGKEATAERMNPKYPFEYMRIRWIYEELPLNVGTLMTWIQEFNVDPKCPWTNPEMESYLNKSTRVQMKAIKDKIEALCMSNIGKECR